MKSLTVAVQPDTALMKSLTVAVQMVTLPMKLVKGG